MIGNLSNNLTCICVRKSIDQSLAPNPGQLFADDRVKLPRRSFDNHSKIRRPSFGKFFTCLAQCTGQVTAIGRRSQVPHALTRVG
jgi:hypothetical protein